MLIQKFTEKLFYVCNFNKVNIKNKHLAVMNRKFNNKLRWPNDIHSAQYLAFFTVIIKQKNI